MIDFLIYAVIVFVAIPFGYIFGKFTVANFSTGIFSFFACTAFALVMIPVGIMMGVQANEEAGFGVALFIYTGVLVLFIMYVQKLGIIFSGFGYFIRPILKPFIYIFTLPYKIFKRKKDFNQVDDAIKKLDDF